MFTPVSLLVGPLWLHMGLRRSVRAHAEADAVAWAQHRAQPHLACCTRRPLVVAGLSGRGCRGPWLCGARPVGNMGLARICMLCVCALRQQSAGGREMHTCRRCACSLHDFGGHGQCPARCLRAGARVLPGTGSPIRIQESASWAKWGQKDSSSQPFDLKSDALPSRHTPLCLCFSMRRSLRKHCGRSQRHSVRSLGHACHRAVS